MIGPAAAALLAETRRRPGRLLLTGLAITVATVFAAGTLLLAETMRAYLTESSQVTPATAAVVVVPDGDPDPGRVAAVAGLDGVASAVGVWSAYLPVGGSTTWQVASDPMRGPLSRLPGAPVAGRLPAGDAEVAIGTATAARTGLEPGSTVTIAPDYGPARAFTVSGVVPLLSEGLDTVIGTPAAVAGLGGQLDQIDVAAVPGTDVGALKARVAAAGQAAVVRTGAEQRAVEVERASTSVTAVLLGVGVFAGLAVVAAGVVVASTFRIVLTQRRTQLALLRCIGARRGQLIGAVLAEGAVTGLVAGLLGVGVAVLAGYGVLAAMRASGAQDVPTLVLWWPGLLAALVVAVLATVLAALAPALAAARIPPVAALGTAGSGETGAPRPGRRLAAAGVLALGAAGLAALAFGLAAELAMIVVAVSGMVAFAALVVAGPVLVRALAATVGRVVGALGRAPGRLAVANAREVPRRTATTIAVLALGVGLTSALLVALASMRVGAEQRIAEQFPTDVVVSTRDATGAAALGARLAADPRLVARTDDTAVFVDPAPGVSEVVARKAVQDAAAGQPGVLVQYAGDARAQLETTVGTVALVGLGLVGMTALVAVVGVGVTLALSVTERTRETGLLRAVGLSRSGVRSMVAWEAALSGTGAALVGAVIGAVYGVLGVAVLDVTSGPSVVPVPTLAALVAGVVAVAVLAALAPAVRAGRVPPIRALQEA